MNTEQLLIHANFAFACIKVGKLKDAEEMIKKAELMYPEEPIVKTVKDQLNLNK